MLNHIYHLFNSNVCERLFRCMQTYFDAEATQSCDQWWFSGRIGKRMSCCFNWRSLSISQGVPHKWGRDGAGKQQTDGCSIDEDVLWWRESRIKAKMSVDSVTPVATSNGYWRNQIVDKIPLTGGWALAYWEGQKKASNHWVINI